MLVLGGRNASRGSRFLSDVWSYEFAAAEWTLLTATTAMGGRFGHSAAAPPDGRNTVYVFGGYSDVGLSAELFACDAVTG
eukprot:7471550-Pyramimonas_sp.AAC.1